jgi:hypothetical protein
MSGRLASSRRLVQSERIMNGAGGILDAGLVHGDGDLGIP